MFRPDKHGRFPAIIWNHGSERSPGAQEAIGEFFTSSGYVVFVPHRSGHGRSPGEYPFHQSQFRGDRAQALLRIIELHERQLEDTVAATGWIAARPYVQPDRMAMFGVSHGAIQALLAAEADAGMAAYVPFAPAAIAWRGNPEIRDRLVRAVRSARAPIFLIQAENDYDLGPSRVLGDELARKGPPNRTRIYPPYGDTPETGHGEFARLGTHVWGMDVLTFLKPLCKPADQLAPP